MPRIMSSSLTNYRSHHPSVRSVGRPSRRRISAKDSVSIYSNNSSMNTSRNSSTSSQFQGDNSQSLQASTDGFCNQYGAEEETWGFFVDL
mmetsp:Transcript_21305/g.23639  ORF Transcript_21305/g.23639 Transcript_21305/m.23639 type:complete len:90 (+) Transcript_21305:114-383(+)